MAPETESAPNVELGNNAPTDGEYRWILWTMLGLAVAVRVVFWVYTERTWEDALITVRHAENAAQGNGLTHHPSQDPPIHGFTSPVSVLIPLAAELVVSQSGVPFQKFVSLLAAAVTILCAYRLLTHPSIRLPPVLLFFALGYLALEHHQILFGMAGMETQCMVAITWIVMLLFVEQRTVALGIACGVAMWVRPDALFLDAAVWFGLLMMRRWRDVFIVPMVAGIVFVPWIIFTTAYYGSFVPHTVTAKDNIHTNLLTGSFELSQMSALLLERWNLLRAWLSPSFGGIGTGTVNFVRGARPLQFVYVLGACIGIIAMLRRKVAVAIPLFVLTYAAYVLIFMSSAHAWYLPPWLGCVAALFAVGLDRVAGGISSPLMRRGTNVVAMIYLVLYAGALTRTFPAERLIQANAELAVRTELGLWLNENVAEDEWIACECLGYLGYYSKRTMLDYPGLASPRSVAALQDPPQSLQTLIAREKPEWLALRPHEWNALRNDYPEAAANYVEQQRFTAPPKFLPALGSYLWIADTTGFKVDDEMIAFRRTDLSSQPAMTD